MFTPAVLDPTVDFLADLAGGGAALELGVGTGRVALPLSQRGVPVHGIDISPAMVEQLRAKPGADAIDVTIGDFATTRVDRSFRLAYLVYNTIMNLTTQEEQVECFRNAAAHLEPGGCFVIELVVPALRRLPPGETVRAFAVTPTYVAFEEFTDMTEAQIVLAPLLGRRRQARDLLGGLSLRVAVGARPDGADRRPDGARALERLDARALHGREHVTRLCLGEAGVAAVSGEDHSGASATTIQGVPNRSTHMPNIGEKNVSDNGAVTSPPSASPSKTRLASPASFTV